VRERKKREKNRFHAQEMSSGGGRVSGAGDPSQRGPIYVFIKETAMRATE
jgi:hypothetical protein